jgi:ribonuclease P protein component
MFGLQNDQGSPRLGITVTRKVGNAVRRNRIKRVFREIFRQNLQQLDVALDLVINARKEIDPDRFGALEDEFLAGFRRLVRGTRM